MTCPVLSSRRYDKPPLLTHCTLPFFPSRKPHDVLSKEKCFPVPVGSFPVHGNCLGGSSTEGARGGERILEQNDSIMLKGASEGTGSSLKGHGKDSQKSSIMREKYMWLTKPVLGRMICFVD